MILLPKTSFSTINIEQTPQFIILNSNQILLNNQIVMSQIQILINMVGKSIMTVEDMLEQFIQQLRPILTSPLITIMLFQFLILETNDVNLHLD